MASAASIYRPKTTQRNLIGPLIGKSLKRKYEYHLESSADNKRRPQCDPESNDSNNFNSDQPNLDQVVPLMISATVCGQGCGSPDLSDEPHGDDLNCSSSHDSDSSESSSDSSSSDSSSSDSSVSDSSFSSSSSSNASVSSVDSDGEIEEAEDRILWLSAYNAQFRVPETGSQSGLLPHLCQVLSKEEMCFNQDRSVVLTEDMLRQYQIEHLTICPGSLHTIPGRGQCDRATCPRFGKVITRQSNKREKEFCLLDCVPQLVAVIEEHGQMLLENHRKARDPAFADSREEQFMYPRIRQSIETDADFANQKLHICVSINFDGFKPNRLSKSSWWPIYLRLETLSGEIRRNKLIYVGFFSTRKEMTEGDIQLVLTRFQGELEAMRLGRVTATIDAVVYRIRVLVTSIVVDLPAARKFLGIGHHNVYQNCLICTQHGTRPARGLVTYSAPVGPLRGVGALNDAIAGRNGFAVRWAPRVLDPSVLVYDYLHCASEGTLRDIVKSVFGTGRKNVKCPPLAPRIGKKTPLEDAVRSILPPTSGHTCVADPAVMNQLNGDEMELLFFVMVPIAVAENVFEDAEVAACILVLWCLLIEVKLIVRDAATVDLVAAAFDDFYRVWELMSARMNGIKAHMLIGHMSFMLRSVGPPHRLSSSHFESEHRKFQRNVNPTTTNNGLEIALRSKLAKATFLPMVKDKALGRSRIRENFQSLHEVMRPGCEIAPVFVNIQQNVYIPKYSTVKQVVPRGAHLLPAGYTFSSRVVINGTPYSAKPLWTRPNRTQSYGVVYRDGADVHFGQIILIGYTTGHRANAKLVVVQHLPNPNPFAAMRADLNTVNTARSVSLLRQLDSCLLRQNSVIRSAREEEVVVDASNVLAPCMFSVFENTTYAMRYVG